uniref:Protein wntless n=1 Tax=Plectus sambesii TaxID=2011161 RepID=A0A914UZI6_9BILA
MNCKPLHFETYVPQPGGNLRDVVFVAQMPHVRGGITLEYSPWFQFLLGLLDIDIEYDPDRHLAENALLQLEVRLGYRTHDDPPTTWHELISTTVTRRLDCSIAEDKKEMNAAYNCSVMDLFELGSNAYPFYLINIRLPVNEEQCMKDPSGPNCAIGRLKDLSIIEIHQNGGFTKIWLTMKTLLTPFVLAATIWYWSRIRQLTRQPYLLEKAIFALGVSLASLDFPLEWLSLWFRLPFMLLVCDLRQGLFYAMLFSFWLIFTGEHLIEDSSRNSLIAYWRHLAFVVVASLCLLVYDMCERGIQLSNPFYSIWSTSVGTNLAYAIIYVASLCALLYFVFLVYKVGRVWSTIKRKRAAALQMNRNRRLKFEMIIYRFKFLMALTVVCAGFTIASYIMKQ